MSSLFKSAPFRRLLSAGSILMILSWGLPASAQTEEMVEATAITIQCEKLKRPIIGFGTEDSCNLLRQLQLVDPIWVEAEYNHLTADDPVQYLASNGPTIDHLYTVEEVREMATVETAKPSSQPLASSTSKPAKKANFSGGIEQWRPLVEAYFPAGEVNRALRVMACESLGDPNAVNASSGASGLFQHMPKYWAERSSGADWGGASIMDPTANVAVAAWVVYEMPGGGWGHWVCKG